MKANHEPEKDASLDRLLQQWVLEEPLPPRFQEQVWHQVRQAEVQPTAGVWTLLASLLAIVLPRPRVAYSYVSLLLVIGVAVGAWEAQKQNSRLETSLGSRYLQSVDPFQAPATDR
jgi:hypothetical protein